ncbi:MFS transporter [Catellatospora sp. KI3]|uniref:MFS transporter n=1 Tax=Catellatospora sp. KI3 TaxID=3041620 RepID=UPI0024823FF4|nr:MFS transporter [Catellatospora sp. KI3]MDI1464099.1 MFS transporter [Catellatospora sp. KI3]
MTTTTTTRLAVPDTRRRPMAVLFTGSAATNVSMVGASTVSTLLGAQLLGPVWSGIPNAAGVIGSAVGTLTLAAVMARHGSRIALVVGYAVAVAGAVVAGYAVAADSATVLMTGMLLLGIGNGGAQLSRYCAADLYPPDRKGFAVGLLVWGGTVGALIGPNLIEPLTRLAGGLGLRPYAGPYLLALVCAAVAGLASTALPATRTRRGGVAAGPAPARVWRLPVVRAAIVSMAGGQVAMVGVMTMTPLQMEMHGHGLGAVGAVLSAHLLGMFALAPLSGHLADRFGARTTIVLGIGVILASAAAALWPATAALYVALFLLGYGWNLTFVGGSSLLTQALTPDERLHVQGGVDAIVWTASAVSSIGAGMLLGVVGYPAVVACSAAVVLLPLLFLFGHRASAPAAGR